MGGEVIGAALGGIEGHVEDGERGGGPVVGALVAVGIEFADIDLAHIMVGKLLQVTLDMGGCERTALIGEDGVDGIPRHLRTVVATGESLLVLRLGEEGGHTGEHPRLGVADADAVLGILEVVDIRGVVLGTAGLTGNQLGKLARETNLGGLGEMQTGQFVEEIGE